MDIVVVDGDGVEGDEESVPVGDVEFGCDDHIAGRNVHLAGALIDGSAADTSMGRGGSAYDVPVLGQHLGVASGSGDFLEVLEVGQRLWLERMCAEAEEVAPRGDALGTAVHTNGSIVGRIRFEAFDNEFGEFAYLECFQVGRSIDVVVGESGRGIGSYGFLREEAYLEVRFGEEVGPRDGHGVGGNSRHIAGLLHGKVGRRDAGGEAREGDVGQIETAGNPRACCIDRPLVVDGEVSALVAEVVALVVFKGVDTGLPFGGSSSRRSLQACHCILTDGGEGSHIVGVGNDTHLKVVRGSTAIGGEVEAELELGGVLLDGERQDEVVVGRLLRLGNHHVADGGAVPIGIFIDSDTCIGAHLLASAEGIVRQQSVGTRLRDINGIGQTDRTGGSAEGKRLTPLSTAGGLHIGIVFRARGESRQFAELVGEVGLLEDGSGRSHIFGFGGEDLDVPSRFVGGSGPVDGSADGVDIGRIDGDDAAASRNLGDRDVVDIHEAGLAGAAVATCGEDLVVGEDSDALAGSGVALEWHGELLPSLCFGTHYFGDFFQFAGSLVIDANHRPAVGAGAGEP